MKLFYSGRWADTGTAVEVTSPFDGSVVDTVPKATAEHVDQALATLVEGAAAMRRMTAFARSEILRRAVAGMHERAEDLARTISAEEGKPMRLEETVITLGVCECHSGSILLPQRVLELCLRRLVKQQADVLFVGLA